MTARTSLLLRSALLAATAPVLPAQTLLHSVEAPDPDLLGGGFASSVAGAGDVDGDGLGDFLVAAPGEPAAGSGAGVVRVYSGADGSLLRRMHGAQGENLGSAMCGLGDLDGDGRGDFALGYREGGSSIGGGVRVHSGASGDLLYEVVVPLARAPWGTSYHLGDAVAPAGDLDGDGLTDLIVSATIHPQFPNPTFWTGIAWVFSGGSGALLGAIEGVPLGTGSPTFQEWVASAGDVDGDGRPDLIVASAGQDGRGLVRVISSASWSELLGFKPLTSDELVLGSVGSAGDWNSDGKGDVFLRRWTSVSTGGTTAVEIRSGADGALLQSLSSTPGTFGMDCVNVGDVDGDARDDLAISSALPGNVVAVRAYAGGTGSPLTPFDRDLSVRSEIFAPLAAAGDVDGDGRSDCILGQPAGLLTVDPRAIVFSVAP